jgi:hypothetical protein
MEINDAFFQPFKSPLPHFLLILQHIETKNQERGNGDKRRVFPVVQITSTPPPSSSCNTQRRKAKREEREINNAFFQSFKSPLPRPLPHPATHRDEKLRERKGR